MLVAEVGPAPGNLVSSIQPHVVPIEFLVVTNQSVTPLERAWTCVGTSEQRRFEKSLKALVAPVHLPSSVGILELSLLLWSTRTDVSLVAMPNSVGMLPVSEFVWICVLLTGGCLLLAC